MLTASVLTIVGLLCAVVVMSRSSKHHAKAHDPYSPSMLLDLAEGTCPRCGMQRMTNDTSNDFWSTHRCSSCGLSLRTHVCTQNDAA